MTSRLTAHRAAVLHVSGDPATDGGPVYFEDGVLVLDEDGRVHSVGEGTMLASLGSTVDVIWHGNALIVPGFVDTHVHYPQSAIIAAFGTQLLDWLERYTFPAEERFHDAQVARTATTFFLDELLRNGTTTALVFGTVHPQSVDVFFEECLERNLRMQCGKVMMDRNAPEYLLDTAESAYHDSVELIERWHGRGRLDYAVTPRFAPTSSDAQLAVAGRLLDEYPTVRLQTHLSENHDECGWVARLFPGSCDYVDVYDRHGLLGSRSVFAHGLHLSEREWERLSESASRIAFCPRSNLFIGSGLFNLAAADRHRVQVGLGTDVGGGDSFSLLGTINEAYKVLQLQRQTLEPMRALYLATLGGARVLGLDHLIGNFEPGKEADFVVLDCAATPLIEQRISQCESIEEKLFALLMLGDDRSIASTWSMGRCVHQRLDRGGK